jgi:hypothetical protein
MASRLEQGVQEQLLFAGGFSARAAQSSWYQRVLVQNGFHVVPVRFIAQDVSLPNQKDSKYVEVESWR